MPSTTFLATDPNGIVHKRTSQNRQYTHTVVALRSKALALAAAVSKDAHRNRVANFQFHREYLDGTSRFLERRTWQTEQQHQEQMATDIQRAREELQGDMDVNDYVARKQREALEDVEKADLAGQFTRYENLGWCGRFDLAQKLASSSGNWLDVTILEAVKKV